MKNTLKHRSEQFQTLSQTTFDTLIIGGGINGSSIANCLSAHGYKVALVEKSDYASFTSQGSSNLIWGGIKYLENYEIGLVNGLCKSRNQLMRAFPNRVKEIRFLATRYKGDKHWLATYYIGAWLYQIIGRFFTKRPKVYSPKKITQMEPTISLKNASGSLEYSDSYLIDNDARFIFHFIEKSNDNGATTMNYVEALESKRNDNLWHTNVIDKTTNKETLIQSKWVINAAGPFADLFNKNIPIKTKHQHVFSKGVHLIVPKISNEEKVITFLSEDNRPVYIIPMQHRNCIGTTDTKVTDIPPKVTDEDREFILRNINHHLNLTTPLSKEDIIAERCGVRPLVVESAGQTNQDVDWLSISRKHQIENEFNKNFLSVFGGKLTDCLNTAQETMEIIMPDIPKSSNAGNWFGEETKNEKQVTMKLKEIFDDNQAKRLWRRYGPKSLKILALQRTSGHPINYMFDENLYFEKEIEYILNHEAIQNLGDLLRRRTELSLIYSKNSLKNHAVLKTLCKTYLPSFSEEQWELYFKG